MAEFFGPPLNVAPEGVCLISFTLVLALQRSTSFWTFL